MSNYTRKWARAGIEVLIHGGTAAIISGITLASSDGDHYGLFTPAWWKMVGLMFAGNGGVRFLQWWQNNPLPPEGSDSITKDGQSLVPQPCISLNPLAKVTTMTTPDTKTP